MLIVAGSGCKGWRQVLPVWSREAESRITIIHTASHRYVIIDVICMLINILQSSFIIYFLIFILTRVGEGRYHYSHFAYKKNKAHGEGKTCLSSRSNGGVRTQILFFGICVADTGHLRQIPPRHGLAFEIESQGTECLSELKMFTVYHGMWGYERHILE